MYRQTFGMLANATDCIVQINPIECLFYTQTIPNQTRKFVLKQIKNGKRQHRSKIGSVRMEERTG
jgi:hypothetical protein